MSRGCREASCLPHRGFRGVRCERSGRRSGEEAIQDATETPLDQIDFSSANLDDDVTCKKLHQAALAQSESEKAASYEEAIQILTRKAVK